MTKLLRGGIDTDQIGF